MIMSHDAAGAGFHVPRTTHSMILVSCLAGVTIQWTGLLDCLSRSP